MFTVQAQSTRAFAVRTGRVAVRVLGTVFAVRRYDSHTAARVLVMNGKVSAGTDVNGSSRGVTLVAGDVAVLTDSGVVAQDHIRGDVSAKAAEGRLVFHNANVGDVLSVVGRWYGVSIRISDPAIAHRLLTAELDVRRTPDELFAALEAVLDVRIRRASDADTTFVVLPRPDRRRPAPERTRDDPLFTPTKEIGR